MAIFQTITTPSGIVRNGIPTVCPSDGGRNGANFRLLDEWTQSIAGADLAVSNQLVKLESAYKIGASGGWERPGSDFA